MGGRDVLLIESKGICSLEETQPTRRLPFLYSRDLAHSRPSTFPPQVAMETSVQENKVRQMEFPFWKAPLPGFHYSHPGPLASEGL